MYETENRTVEIEIRKTRRRYDESETAYKFYHICCKRQIIRL